MTGQLPAELLAGSFFVGWRFETRAGKETKIPVNPNTGMNASATDSHTWSDYATVSAAVEKYKLSGIGRVVTDLDPFTGVDLDKCLGLFDGELEPWAESIVKALDSYTEITPSGEGVRIWVKAKLPADTRKRTGKFEVYSRGRYFTLTGNPLSGTRLTVEPRQQELEKVCDEMFGTPERNPVPRAVLNPDRPETFHDAELIRRAGAALNGAKFLALMDGDIDTYHGGDHSVADLALCSILAFWSGNAGQIDRIFRASKLIRPKWDSPRRHGTYGSETVLLALSTGRMPG